MGVVAIKIPVNPVLTGSHILVPIATPAKSVGLACPDIVVSKKLIANNDICVTKIGKNSNTNCFNFCENEVVSFIKSPFHIKKQTLTIIQFNQRLEKKYAPTTYETNKKRMHFEKG